MFAGADRLGALLLRFPMQDLGTVSGDVSGVAIGVDDAGQIVGV